jgi:hypothetical protein
MFGTVTSKNEEKKCICFLTGLGLDLSLHERMVLEGQEGAGGITKML